MAQAELPSRGPHRVVRRQAVADQSPRKRLAEDLLDDLVPAAATNDVQRRLRGHEVPQPGRRRSDPPAGLVGVDGRTGPDGLFQALIDRLGLAGQALAGLRQGPRGHADTCVMAEEVRHLAKRDAQAVLEVRRQGDGVRADLRAGRAGGRRGLLGMPAANPLAALGAVAPLGLEPANDGCDRRQVGLDDGAIVGDPLHGTAAVGAVIQGDAEGLGDGLRRRGGATGRLVARLAARRLGVRFRLVLRERRRLALRATQFVAERPDLCP